MTGEVDLWGGDIADRGGKVSLRLKAFSDELVQGLGMSPLELREEDLAALGER